MTEEKAAFLFIDDTNIENLDGVVKGVVPAKKVSQGPLIKKDRAWEEEWLIGSYINVLYDDEEKIFKMWYGVGRKLSEARGEEADGLAYAVSQDGIHWEKPVLNLVEDGGSKENNLVFPILRWGAGTGVMKDPIETDPAKRYKMLFMFQSGDMIFAGITQPVCVAYSADGIHWNVPKGWLNPVIPRGSDTQLVAYWDAKIHRYVVYLRGQPNVRIICMAESDDFENWTPRQIIVAPDALDPPQDHEFYGMSSLTYRDFRIGFLSVFHTLYEGWIAQNQVEGWMPEWMNKMDIQLTYSKDGRTWHRAGNREPILICGPPGSHDCGNVYPPHAPFVLGEEIWVYHGASNGLHGEPPTNGEPLEGGINLAKIEKDRLVCLKTDALGVVTTVPLSIDPHALWINADATGGSLQVEIVDPFGRVVPGFGKDDCIPFSGNETAYRVEWKSDPQGVKETSTGGLEEKMVSQARGGLKVKVYLDRARLFALYERAPLSD
jgi:hypothetical protein